MMGSQIHQQKMTPKVVHPIREYSLMCTSNVAIHKNLPDRKTGIPEDNRKKGGKRGGGQKWEKKRRKDVRWKVDE